MCPRMNTNNRRALKAYRHLQRAVVLKLIAATENLLRELIQHPYERWSELQHFLFVSFQKSRIAKEITGAICLSEQGKLNKMTQQSITFTSLKNKTIGITLYMAIFACLFFHSGD